MIVSIIDKTKYKLSQMKPRMRTTLCDSLVAQVRGFILQVKQTITMKKYIFVLVLLLVPSLTFASFDVNLKYGAKGDAVTELQEFLIEQGNMTGSATGNFYSLTLKAVKAFQLANDLPSTGYWGALSRAKAQSLLSLSDSDNAEQAETGTISSPIQVNNTLQNNTLNVNSTITSPIDVCSNIPGIQETLPDGMGFGGDTQKECFPHTNSVSIQKSIGNSPNSPIHSYNEGLIYAISFVNPSTPVVFKDASFTIQSNDFNTSDVRFVADSGFGKFTIPVFHAGKLKIIINSITAVDAGGNVQVLNLPFETDVIEIAPLPSNDSYQGASVSRTATP